MNPITLYNGCTLYDMVEKYGYTLAEIFGDFPVWDDESTTRSELLDMIYDYFANREIASETPEQFSRFAKIRITRLMLKVNTVAETVLSPDALTWDITGQVADVANGSTFGTRTPNLTSTTNATSENKATALQSDTPQVQLSGTENYMTALSESGGTGETHSTSTETGSETTAGTNSATNNRTIRDGSIAQRAALWVEMLPDIYGFILDGLEPLFMQVWS